MIKKLIRTICLSGFVSVMLCACGKQRYQGNPVVLPAKEDIISIGVSDGEKYAFSPNTEEEAEEFISEFLSVLMDMDITDQQSVTDAPTNKDYITISLNCDDKTTTLFYYKDKGTEYVEQPYQGIYKPAPALGYYITEMFDSADQTLQTVAFQADQPSRQEKWDLIPMVMIDSELYLDTGLESTAKDRRSGMDGEITSEVDGSEQPAEDNQSNFGTGYEYQYGAVEGTVDIYINGKWWIFATKEARQEIQFPTE